MSDIDPDVEKQKLAEAIRAYHAAVEPDAYVADWVLVSHKMSPELEQANQSAVGVLMPTGQTFVTTHGLLGVAVHQSQNGWSVGG
ncbi:MULTISPECIES: hypothetical protein [unclassified Pseudoclavibacter]|uniref:hypothetical protein n=1 Tax=unclassified Pseudoclavibacter TaxID=2615177 RepID=UPI001BA74FFC|nr:hypothetical protein [Pseudoclavibacter sp. Marseille-Q4354]MBS3177740.1 hypothetical protein [Pseudoclavibacter sp. Marseille-Q4354]